MGLRSRVHGFLLVAAAASALAAVPLALPATLSSSAQAAASDRAVVRVATFNIRSVKNDAQLSRGEQPWRDRRGAVIRQILAEHLDVVGLQEASQNGKYKKDMVDGPNQFLDLRNGLRKAGGHWQLTSTAAYNCVRPNGSHDCVYQDRGASRTTKIIYNTDKVEKVRSGSYKYEHQSGGTNDDRYLAWAVFADKATGRRFFFADTHLATGSSELQKNQWRELIAKVDQLKDGLPTIVVGDFQRSRMKHPVTDMLTAMRNAGYGDVLGQRPDQPVVEDPRAERTRREWVNSMNHFDRNVRDFSFEDNRKRAGNFIDWIFASNNLPVRSYEVVADIDPRTLQLRGVIPSDHNMVRASIVLN